MLLSCFALLMTDTTWPLQPKSMLPQIMRELIKRCIASISGINEIGALISSDTVQSVNNCGIRAIGGSPAVTVCLQTTYRAHLRTFQRIFRGDKPAYSVIFHILYSEVLAVFVLLISPHKQRSFPVCFRLSKLLSTPQRTTRPSCSGFPLQRSVLPVAADNMPGK